MTVIKQIIEPYQKDLFVALNVGSWLDLLVYLIACCFSLFFLSFILLLPLVFFFVLFLYPMLH